jgi:hypothetical protein
MVCLISMLSAIFCSLFSWIEFFGKLLIFPTKVTEMIGKTLVACAIIMNTAILHKHCYDPVRYSQAS